MNRLLGESGLIALALFASIALAVLAIVLAWEGARRVMRQRSIMTQLRRLETGSDAVTPGAGLLRAARTEGPAWLEALLLRVPHQRDLKNFLEQGDMRWSVATFLLATVGLAAAFGLAAMVVLSGFLPVLPAIVGALIPYVHVSRKRKQRFAKFEEHFPDSIDILGRAIRAGHAFTTGLEVVAEEANEPVASEFRQVFEEQKFGLPLGETLLALADRMAILDVRIFVTAVMIQRESGGNLAEILDNLSYVIRERFKFRRQLKVHTAHGRMTGFVLAMAPVVAGLGMYVLNPDYMIVLFTEPAGRIMLAVAVGLQLFGFLVIRRLVDIKF
ncbi:MAG: type II secretion system F family protein [Gemmatimonadota bacterium]|jgi:tight adherence protein B|nr:MAG: type II secretion system F family protein [Gemmatimonadota bacterium]